MTLCEVDTCPAETPAQELVVLCSGYKQAPQKDLVCRFSNGTTSPAHFDTETQRISCRLPQDMHDESKSFELFSGEDHIMDCKQGESCQMLHSCAGGGKGSPLEAGKPHQPTDSDSSLTAIGLIKSLSFLDRYLALWIVLAMIIGVVCGYFIKGLPQAFGVVDIQGTSLPIAFGLWFMMWPVLSKVRYEIMFEMFKQRSLWFQLTVSLVLNWIVGPLLMTGLAWATLPDLDHYRNGVIMVGLARCIAMVLIWNQLAAGHPEFCAILVAVNSILQIILYSPLALFYLKVVSHQYSGAGQFDLKFWDILRSVLIFLGIPLVAAIITRYSLIALKGREWFDKKFMPYFGPLALVALIYTIWVMFALQGHQVIENIGSVFRVAVPMLLYFSIMWIATMLFCRAVGVSYEKSVTQAFTASSNNFELAIAVATAVFGITSPEALAATVGPLIEVPVLLALSYVALWLHKKLKWAA
ncbi:g13483 [Coccomyxa viridis]|uniref:G13483 protein n=1 Tax=Coccomyxa viridis TaxID=1274662 RepID=A0ABP1GK01_9CHLO